MSESNSYEIEIAGTADGGGGSIPELSPREASERWLNKLLVDKSESTVSSYHYRLKHFVEWCEANEILTINEVTGWDLESFEAHRREQELKPVSLSKELGTLRNFLEYCARIELVDPDLPDKVDLPTVDTEDFVDETRLDHNAAQSLLEYYRETPSAYGSRSHVVLSLAWYTGARLSALRGLDIEDYSSDERFVDFVHRPEENTPLKNDTDGERVVALPEPVCVAIDQYIEHNRHDVHDDFGRKPLLTSTVGRPSRNSVRAWMYQATLPCLHSDCPHGKERETCDWTEYHQSSKCPSSRSPHQVRTGSITWQLNRGIPTERVSERVNSSVRVLERHYDQPSKREEMEERRREYVDDLSFDNGGGQ